MLLQTLTNSQLHNFSALTPLTVLDMRGVRKVPLLMQILRRQ